jgi:hypothetical protein
LHRDMDELGSFNKPRATRALTVIRLGTRRVARIGAALPCRAVEADKVYARTILSYRAY